MTQKSHGRYILHVSGVLINDEAYLFYIHIIFTDKNKLSISSKVLKFSPLYLKLFETNNYKFQNSFAF